MHFLAFEGLDGSGKSTLIRRLGEVLDKSGVPYRVTREPGGTGLADEIRHLLLRHSTEAPVPRTELLLYEASRSQHVENVIRPALAKGEWVLCDRFYASTYAYQCGGRNLKETDVDWLNNYAVDSCHPDLWILLDLEVEESVKRVEKRRASADRFELEKVEFHERVRQAYLKLSRRDPEKWLVLDAKTSPEQLAKKFFDELRRRGWLA